MGKLNIEKGSVLWEKAVSSKWRCSVKKTDKKIKRNERIRMNRNWEKL